MPILEKKPEPIKPLPVKPEPKPEIKPAPQIAAVKPIQKPKNPNATKTKEDREFDDVLKSVLDLEETPKPSAKPAESGGQQGPKGLTESDMAQIGRQIEPCWEMQETRDIDIKFKVDISKEGRFANPLMDETYEITSNPVNRSLAEAAHRALLNSKCNDVNWLKKKYRMPQA
jgi:outer membrane biosynthesis protein TonB